MRSVESEIFLTCYKVQIIVFNTHVHTHTYQHNREFLREHAVETVGLKRTGNRCLGGGSRGNCRYLNHCVLLLTSNCSMINIQGQTQGYSP